MKVKKLISLFLVTTIIFSFMIMPASAEEISNIEIVELINDNFGASTDADGGLNGWTVKEWADGVDMAYVLTTEAIGDDNYALKYTVSTLDDWKYSYIEKALDTSLTFTKGVDIVLETRMKQTQSGGRSFIKFNMKNTGTYNGQEWLYNWGTLLINEDGVVDTVNGWSANNYAVQERMATGLQNVWYTVKITIHGNTKTISVVVDDENGNVYTKSNMSIDYKDEAGWVEDVLNSFNFRMRNTNTLYVDYFRAYQLIPNIPVAKDVTVSGRLIPNTSLSADYLYNFDDEEQGASVFKWYTAASKQGPWNELTGKTEKTLLIDSDLAQKYIKFSVTPVSLSGIAGDTEESSIISPEEAPVINNLTISSSNLFVNTFVSAKYDYYDANYDKEAESEIIWYALDTELNEWIEVYDGKNFRITEECVDKYIKCAVVPVSEGTYLQRGSLYESMVVGPVRSADDLLTETNLLQNPGLEDGVITPWVYTKGETSAYKGIELEEDDVYSGNYALHAHPRIVNANDGWNQPVYVEKGKTYILSGMAKTAEGAKDVAGFEGYSWSPNLERPYRDLEYVAVSDKWVRVTLTIVPTSSGQITVGFLSFTAIDADVIMDDMYLGELMITDIGNIDVEPIQIPETGSVKVLVTDGKIFNQFNEAKGFNNETVTLNFPETQGISAEGNYLVVDSTALAGKLQVELVCNPTYPGATGSYSETIEVELVAATQKPVARNVTVSGDVGVGNTLNATYEFYQAEGKTDASTVNWMYADSENGTFNEIPGATSLTYTVTEQYADKFIRIKVAPKTIDGDIGDIVYSNVVTNPRVPVASNIKISGDFKVGGTVTATYDYYDPNKDAEGTSTYRWMIADSIDGMFAPIQGQTTKNLTFTEEMIDKYIKFGVTPVSTVAPESGVEVCSDTVLGPTAPTASNLKISKSGTRLTGSYVYTHAHNAKEKGTTYKWLVDGVLISTNSSYVIDFSGTRTVTFSVTPAGDTNPSIGETVSVSVTLSGETAGGISGGTTSGGGGTSGGVSGGGSVGGVTNINNMQLPTVEAPKDPEKEETKTDIDNHWGKDYIKEMEARGVMVADDNGNFDPDKNVTRQDMLTFLFDALSLEESDYSNQFSDVKDGDFAKKLQTMVNNGTIAKDETFRPNDTISREEMCKILYVSLDNAGKLNKVEEGLINSFVDFDGISDWAKVYVNAIYGNKIMVGVSDTEFDAKGTVTKAQAATMLTRILKLTEEAE